MNKKLLGSLSALVLCLGLQAQVSVTGGSSATYTSVNAAFNAINLGTHTGAITIDITGNTTEPVTPIPLIASGQGAANYTSIVLRPTVTATISGNMVTGRGILEFDGADNFTINGDVAGGAVGRDLSIVHTGLPTVLNTACVRLIGRATLGLGATNFSLLNSVLMANSDGTNTVAPLISSHCFYAGGNGLNLTTSGTGNDYDNLTITNNEFKRAYYAIHAGNLTPSLGDNTVITNNIIGSSNPAEYVHFRGINLNAVNNATVSGNDISNLRIASSTSNAGIEVNGTTSNNVLVERNKIYSIYSTSVNGWGAWGINFTGGTNHTIVNNVVYDIVANNYVVSTTFNAFGIRLTSGTGYKVYYNSVNMFGNYPTVTSFTGAVTACFLVSSTAVTGDVRNNIFCNQMTSTASNVTTKRFMAVWMPAAYNFANMNFNNNAYMVSAANTTDYFVGKVGTTIGTFEYQNLAAWQAASQVGNPTNDVSSIPLLNTVAPFISNTNLNFASNAVTPIESGAVTLTVLGTPNKDYNTVNRPAGGVNPNTNPDIGAYEFDGLAGVSNDVGIINLTAPANLQCLGSSVPAAVTIRNYGINTIAAGVVIPVTIITSGAFSQTITSNYTVPVGGFASLTNAQFTLATNLNMSAFGTYTVVANTAMATPLDNNTVNDAFSTTRINAPQVAIPLVQGFTGFTGANLTTLFPDWYEAIGNTFPVGPTSSWLSQTNLNAASNITARVNLFGNTRREWIVGPKILAAAGTQVTFDAAITGVSVLTAGSNMGSDDQLLVMISTNCGASYTPIFTVNVTNSLTTNFSNFVVPLGAYANQEVIIGFLATDGIVDDIESYDLHLDNININNVVANDVGVNAFTTPVTSGCYSANTPITVVFRNFGTASQSNINVSVAVSGPVTTTINTVIPGPVTPSSTLAVVVGSINMVTGGTYVFKGYSSLVGDGNLLNDTTTTTRVVNPLLTLPVSNNFTGFTGANLPIAWPNWSEATGSLTPSGTTSSWLSQTNLNGAGNITARVNLLGNVKNEWIIGPRTLATSSTQISFDYALTSPASVLTTNNMGSDDNVRVMVSTNCGLSYVPVYTLNVSNTNSLNVNFSNVIVPLSSFAGQEIIVAFLASEGTIDDIESYDFHLDNINLYNGLAADGGVASIISPSVQATCYTANEPVVVTIKNYGTAAISNVPVNVLVSGAVTQTVSGTYAPSIPVGGTATFTVGNLNMTFSGAYSFSATTNLGGDVNLFNNSSIVNTTTTPVFNVLGNLALCTGGTTTLTTSNAGLTYTWSTAATTNSIVVSPVTTPTSYTCTGSDGICTSIKVVTVTVTSPTITGIGTSVCSPTAVGTLTANAFAPVNWYATPTSTTSLALGNTYTASAPTNTTYYAEAQSTATGTLFTTLAAGNGSSGNMFDVVAQSNIEVNGFDVHISSVAVTTVEVWYRPGTFVGFESSNAGWTNVVTTTVNALGTGSLTLVPVNFSVNIPAGQTYGFYVTANGGGSFAYTNGVAVGNVFSSNSDVSILEGKGGGYYAVTIATRIFNGQMRYTKVGCTSTRIPVTLTVSPTPTVSVNSSTTAVCSGGTATLTANGATTYSWSNSATTSSIVVNPTVTTTYSVSGATAGCTSNLALTTLSINPAPAINASPIATICINSSTTFTANGASTYTWTPGNLSGPSVVLSPSFTTVYSVAGTGTNGCVGTATTGIVVSGCVGLNEKGISAITNVYPNPNTGFFVIELNNATETTLELMDVTGRIVLNTQFTEIKHEVNMSNIANGVYYARIKNANGSNIVKIVKE